MIYLYGMRLRGASIGTQPKNGLIEVRDGEVIEGHSYYNILAYNRELRQEELNDYELDFIGGKYNECIKFI